MKANEVFQAMSENKLFKIGKLSMMPARSHYKFYMELGRVFPTTREQAKFFLNKHIAFDLLSWNDVEKIEELCKKHGMGEQCEYRIGKSFARLTNPEPFEVALKKEYNL